MSAADRAALLRLLAQHAEEGEAGTEKPGGGSTGPMEVIPMPRREFSESDTELAFERAFQREKAEFAAAHPNAAVGVRCTCQGYPGTGYPHRDWCGAVTGYPPDPLPSSKHTVAPTFAAAAHALHEWLGPSHIVGKGDREVEVCHDPEHPIHLEMAGVVAGALATEAHDHDPDKCDECQAMVEEALRE